MRRNLFIVGLVVGIVLTAYFYSDVYYLLTRKSVRFKAVPVESGFFFDVKGLAKVKAMSTELKLEDKINQLEIFQKALELKSFFSFFDTTSNNSFLLDINTEHLIIAGYPTRPGNVELTYILQMNESSSSLLQAWLSSNSSVQSDTRTVRGKKVYDIKLLKENKFWTVGFWHGLCIISHNTYLVEEAIVQLKGATNITDDKNFKTLDNADDAFLNLYINYSNLSSMAQGFANDYTQTYLQSLDRFASWSGFGFKPAQNGLQVSGYTSTDENGLQSLNDYKVSGSYKLWSLQQKPDNSSLIISSGVSTGKNEPKSFYNSADYKKYFSSWLDNEVSYVLVEPVDTAYGNQSLLFLRTKDAATSLKALKPLSNVSNDSLSRLPFNYKSYTINQLTTNGLVGRLLPNPFTDFASPYYTVAGNYVVMSNSLTQLKLYLERLSDGKTMDKMKVAGMNTNSFSTGSYNVYFNLLKLKDLFASGARSELRSSVMNDVRLFGSLSPVYLQFTPDKNGFKVDGFISSGKQTVAAKSSQYLWKASFDTAVILVQPLGVNDVGEKQVAVQDVNNVLYMLNRGGDIMWKNELDGPVRGKIHPIDFYKNGDRQYVFATSGKIYMIDQTGDAVQNFPISFPCNATTALSVVDMDGDKNYNYFIGCENGLVYGYEKGGKSKAGWNPNSNASGINELKYFRYRSREFLMGITYDGWIKFFNRYGDDAFKPLPLEDYSANEFIADDERGFRAVANNGTEYRLGYDGKITTVNSPLENISDAIIADVIAEKPGYEKIMFDGKRITIYTSDSNRVKQFTLSKPADGKLFVVKNGDTYYIGIAGNTKVWLLNSDGKMVSGFPHTGNGMFTPVDLYNTDQPALIGLVDERTVIAYPVE